MKIAGKSYKGNYEPLITQELFESAQEANVLKSRPRPKRLKFLYRGFAVCEVCGCQYTASLKKEKYTYYYCTNSRNLCNQHRNYLDEGDMEALAKGIFSGLTLDENLATRSLQEYEKDLRDKYKYRDLTCDSIDNQIKKNVEKQEKLLDLLLEGKITQEVYDKKLESFKKDKKDLLSQKTTMGSDTPDCTLELLERFKNEAISFEKVFSEGDDEVKDNLLKSVLWNFSIKDKEVANVRYKTMYEVVVKTSKSANFANWLRNLDSNQDTILQRDVSYH